MPQLPDVPLDGLYGDLIMDHYKKPRNRTPVPDADVEVEEFNPFCGDLVAVQLKLDEEGRVAQVSARSEGCSIIQASASMMSDLLAGKALEEVDALSGQFRDLMQGKLNPDVTTEKLGDLGSFRIVRLYPVRIKCALLPWTALEKGIAAFRARAG